MHLPNLFLEKTRSRIVLPIAFLLICIAIAPVSSLMPKPGTFELTSPVNGSSVQTQVNFSWNAHPNAYSYRLVLSSVDDPDFEGPDYVIRTKQTSISNELYPMEYIARVVARNQNGKRIARTPTISFTVSKSSVSTSTTSTTKPSTTSTSSTKPATTTTTKPIPTTTTSTPNNGKYWTPKPGTTWYWQINGKVNENENATMYDIDLFEAVPSARSYTVAGFGNVKVPQGPNAGVIERLKAKGKIVICYVDTGAAEYNRPDYNLIPTSVQGTVAEASDGTKWTEKWLDTRSESWSKWAPVMWARFDLAKQIGCDGVEPDQNNHVGNKTGFPESVAIDKAWYLEVAKQAHARGLSVGQKNGIETVDADMVKAFDWHLNEECNQYSECDLLVPFIEAGKAVFNAEYPKVSGGASQSLTCKNATRYGLSSMGYPLELGGGYFFDCLTGTSLPTGTSK